MTGPDLEARQPTISHLIKTREISVTPETSKDLAALCQEQWKRPNDRTKDVFGTSISQESASVQDAEHQTLKGYILEYNNISRIVFIVGSLSNWTQPYSETKHFHSWVFTQWQSKGIWTKDFSGIYSSSIRYGPKVTTIKMLIKQKSNGHIPASSDR